MLITSNPKIRRALKSFKRFVARTPKTTPESAVEPKPEPRFYTRDLVHNANCEFGEHTYGKPVVHSWDDDTKLRIGRYTSIAEDVTIVLGGEHRTDWISTYPFSSIPEAWPGAAKIVGHPKSNGDVVIGNDVWLGLGATVLSGVSIGDGAVVAARAMVVKDVPPYTVVGGNPARELRQRFSDKQVEQLLKIKWWQWSDAKVSANVHLLCSGRIDAFIKLHANVDSTTNHS